MVTIEMIHPSVISGIGALLALLVSFNAGCAKTEVGDLDMEVSYVMAGTDNEGYVATGISNENHAATGADNGDHATPGGDSTASIVDNRGIVVSGAENEDFSSTSGTTSINARRSDELTVPGRRPRAIEVRAAGPLTSIAAAAAMSQPFDTIRVYEGVYTEAGIEITHPLILEGVGRPLIDGNGGGFILTIRSDSVQVRGFKIRNTGVSYVRDFAAILLEDASDFIVEDNHLDDVFFGIYLARTTRGIIRNNRIESYDRREASSGNGIHLWSVVNPEIVGNTIIGMRDGIYLEFAENADIRQNISSGNNRYGLHYMFSNGGRYYQNVFRENGAGVAVMYSDRVNMTDNLFEFNWGPSAYGLLLKDIRHSIIERNRFIRNTIAIYAEGVSHTTITGNEIRRNGWAVNIKSNSMRNTFSGNNFVENSQDVRTDSPRNPNTFDGNYWSHYEGYDLDRDGIGDIPYRPVSLFSIIIERQPEALILMRSMFIRLLDMAERVMPVLTPKTLFDENPLMQPVRLDFHQYAVTPIATNQ